MSISTVQFRRPKVTDRVIDLNTFIRMQEWLERIANCQFSQDFIVDKSGNLCVGLRKMSAATDFDASIFSFGYSVSGAVITVSSGWVIEGSRDPVECAETDLTIVSDHTFVYCAYSFNGTTASISQSLTRPKDTETTHNRVLHKWRLINGVASIEKVHHLGDITLPGNYA